jgi:hypothetical protein
MSKIKSLILGSAAGLVAIAGAQAADLPVKAKAVQYVKICSLYGAGFYYIPGTETCIKLGGYAQFDAGIHGGFFDNPYFSTGATTGSPAQGFNSRDQDAFQTRTRFAFQVDARTATEYGVVRAYSDVKEQWTTNTDGIAGGNFETDNVFVQFAGFTFGKAASAYSTPWHSVGGNNNTSSLLGGHDNLTGTPQISYTWQFGNGLSAQLGVEDAKAYDRSQIINGNQVFAGTTLVAAAAAALPTGSTGVYANNYGGEAAPDINGNIRLDQAAYTVQLSAAAHDNHALYYTNGPVGPAAAPPAFPQAETNGAPADRWGYAVQGGFQLKNLPTGAGDKLTMDIDYAKGANRYVIGGTTGNNFGLVGGASNAGSYQGIALGTSADAVYGNGTQLFLTKAYGLRGGFVHNWSPTWESDVFGSYSKVEYGANAAAIFCAQFTAITGAKSNGYSCNPNFAIYQVGTRLGWTPVQNLTLSGEVMYSFLDQNNTGSAVLQPSAFKPVGAIYDFKDLGTVSGNLRIRRTF